MTCQTLKGNYLNEFFTKIFDCYNIKRFVGTLKWGYTVCTVNICGQSAVPSVHIELCKTWFFYERQLFYMTESYHIAIL